MPTTISCPHCGKSYQFEDKYDGKIVRCQACRGKFEIDIGARKGLVVFDAVQAVSIDSVPSAKSGDSNDVSIGELGTIAASTGPGLLGSVGEGTTIVGDEAIVGHTAQSVDILHVPIEQKYKILKELGRGGMGVVYLAEDRSLGRQVVIKRLQSGSDPSDRSIIRFLNEAKSIAKLNHPNIVTVYEVAKDDLGIYLAMEHVTGGDLQQYLDRCGKLPQAEAVELCKKIAEGLSHAHQHSIIHRDIKPANILLDETGQPKITDFGLAKMWRGGDLSKTGSMLGTPLYMAPEQMGDAKHIDQRADIYALGKVLYQMLTGLPPHSVDVDEVPAEVRPVLKGMLKPRQEDRYFGLVEVINELSAVTKGKQDSISAVQTRHTDQIVCPKCTIANNTNTRFCVGCGTQLYTTCPKCEQEIPVDVMHCGKCGVHVEKTRLEKRIVALREAIDVQVKSDNFDAALNAVDKLAEIDICKDEAAQKRNDIISNGKQYLQYLRDRITSLIKKRLFDKKIQQQNGISRVNTIIANCRFNWWAHDLFDYKYVESMNELNGMANNYDYSDIYPVIVNAQKTIDRENRKRNQLWIAFSILLAGILLYMGFTIYFFNNNEPEKDIANNAEDHQDMISKKVRFVVSAGPDGKKIVMDKRTKLTWTKEYWENKDWEEAVDLCDSLVYADHNDWRLPTEDELETLLFKDMGKAPYSTFPDMPSDWFWSSSSIASYADGAWLVDFGHGGVGDGNKDDGLAARCVRP